MAVSITTVHTIHRYRAAIASIVALVLCVAPFGLNATGQSRPRGFHVSGYVRDSITAAPLPYASVAVPGEATGTLTDNDGRFGLSAPRHATQLVVSCLGYRTDTISITPGASGPYNASLMPTSYELSEVVVRKQKYTKKDNPAVEFVRRLRTMSQATDPLRNDYYNYDRYQLMTLALNDFGSPEQNRLFARNFPFVWEYVDTSEISGKPILNVIFKEKTSRVHYRRSPNATKEVVTAIRQDGIDEVVDPQSVRELMDDLLREVDLYQNDIVLMHNRFVSPLSSIAPDFYKFYLTDTVVVDNERCIVLSFYPHNKSTFGFMGQVYVPVADSAMFIKKVMMHTPKEINLDFINRLYITQEFVKAPDGSRLKVRDDLKAEMSLVPGTSGFYVRRDIGYANHNFLPPDDMGVFDRLESQIVLDTAGDHDEQYWSDARLVEVTDNERQVGTVFERLRKVPFYYWSEKAIEIFFSGYIHTSKDSKVDLGPVNTTVSSNTIEGVRLRTGGITTANLSPHWFAGGYVAYGTKDRKWKYQAELEYSFNAKRYYTTEFPIHSIKVSSMYDIDQLGQHYLFTNKDNAVLSLKRLPDTNVTYQRVNAIDYTLELGNHLSIGASLRNVRQEATRYIPFVDGHGNNYRHYDENMMEVQLRYAPNERIFQKQTERILINNDGPVFMLTHTYAPAGFLGSMFAVNKTEASYSRRVWFSAFGSADIIVKGGHVWSRSPFINLLIPNANLSYTIQPESFALMNAMEFVNDTYAMLDLTYWANGAILNYIPYVRKLKLREVFTFKGYWGRLSRRNDPERQPDLFRFPSGANVTRMTNTPYMEVAVGLDNILDCMRLDYVWRLTYRDVPYRINRGGLRLSVHVAF